VPFDKGQSVVISKVPVDTEEVDEVDRKDVDEAVVVE
jgi:hypothetical protein